MMWLLIFAVWVDDTHMQTQTVPGYATRQECEAAAAQVMRPLPGSTGMLIRLGRGAFLLPRSDVYGPGSGPYFLTVAGGLIAAEFDTILDTTGHNTA